jgi:hypothetical protein
VTIFRRARTAANVLRMLPCYLAVGVLKHFVPVTTIARWLTREPAAGVDRHLADRITAASRRIRQWSPIGDRDCLQRSLVLFRHLPRAGLTPSLAMGFRRVGGRLEGHAWVVIDDRAFDEAGLTGSPFEETCRIGPDGRTIVRAFNAAPIATSTPNVIR